VATFAKQLVDFAGNILSGANETFNKLITSNEGLVTKVLNTNTGVVGSVLSGSGEAISAASATAKEALSTAQLGADSILSKILPIAVIGGLVVLAINAFKKRG